MTTSTTQPEFQQITDARVVHQCDKRIDYGTDTARQQF
jgi:hypothetical protein